MTYQELCNYFDNAYQLENDENINAFKEAKRLFYVANSLYEEEHHLVYDADKWITNYKAEFYKTPEEAKQHLYKILSKKNGVEILSNGNIQVKTNTKYYIYGVRVYYFEEEGYGARCVGALINYNRNHYFDFKAERKTKNEI